MSTVLEIRLLAGRGLRHIPRIPEKAVGAVLLPLVFVLLFAYVFGSANSVPGGGYHEYLVAGIFAQSMVGPVPGIAVGVAADIRSGLMDRLRTLPIASGSVIAGRAVAELVELAGGLVVTAICGLIVGWAPHGSVLETAGAFGLLLLMAFAVTWVGTLLGLLVRDPDRRGRHRHGDHLPGDVPVGDLRAGGRAPLAAARARGAQPADRPGHRRPAAVPQPDGHAAGRVDAPASRRHVAAVGVRPDGRVHPAGRAALPADGPLSVYCAPWRSSRSLMASPRYTCSAGRPSGW
jgi:ABC-2 type transporter